MSGAGNVTGSGAPRAARKAGRKAGRKARKVEQSDGFQWLVRAGFVSRAITYGVIGGLAMALALGGGTLGAAPNQQGALALIARAAVGRIALVVIAAGLLGYALWKLEEGILARGPEGSAGTGLKDRVSNLAAGLSYLVFFVVAVRALTGSGGNSSKQPPHDAAGVLGWPGGTVLVAAGGIVLLGVSLYQLYDAATTSFAEDNKTSEMNPRERHLFRGLGRVGIGARALVFCLVGYFLVRTALDFNPREAVGVDGALGRLHQAPLGPWLVGLAAVGLLTFAVFSLFEARYRRL